MDAMGIIFSNVHDQDLKELTETRAFASVPFGGRYRLVDFVLSNMVNSGITNIGIIVKSRYLSLMDHVGTGKEWDLDRKRGGLFVFPPYARTSDAGIYRGRLEALAGIRSYLRRSLQKYVILSDSNIVCSMDFGDVVKFHEEQKADITVVHYKGKAPESSPARRVCYRMSGDARVTDLMVDPPFCEGQNIGLDMLVIERDMLTRIVEEAAARGHYSLTRDFLLKHYHEYRIFGYEYEDYFARIDSIPNFFAANMALLQPETRQELFYNHGDVYTKVRDEVPARYGAESRVLNSLVADGCVVEGEVENSVIFRGVRVGRKAKIRNSIIMQGATISEYADMEYIIADKDVVVKPGRTLAGSESYPVVIRKGSVV